MSWLLIPRRRCDDVPSRSRGRLFTPLMESPDAACLHSTQVQTGRVFQPPMLRNPCPQCLEHERLLGVGLCPSAFLDLSAASSIAVLRVSDTSDPAVNTGDPEPSFTSCSFPCLMEQQCGMDRKEPRQVLCSQQRRRALSPSPLRGRQHLPAFIVVRKALLHFQVPVFSSQKKPAFCEMRFLPQLSTMWFPLCTVRVVCDPDSSIGAVLALPLPPGTHPQWPLKKVRGFPRPGSPLPLSSPPWLCHQLPLDSVPGPGECPVTCPSEDKGAGSILKSLVTPCPSSPLSAGIWGSSCWRKENWGRP
ncbi:uncharacterized protein LOC125081715 isoform X2 [Lutra lutra]|uniref:uncharacterized protein LOC125081715 isoform X2 n=1 Tax=Lutra lutra TaxID=9657 RepID=UPI001FD509CF|nr:uncharacterized protein LOC125081715 isoform X2 [Lutra lutra]